MYETVIGLEVHVQLATARKLLCACPTSSVDANTASCPVCLGHPGTLPVVDDEAVQQGVRAARALGFQVADTSRWARKHYFYDDLPKGYQVTQDTAPLATGGRIHFLLDGQLRSLRLVRLHLEEDSARTVHADGHTWLDHDRAGMPLVEIVSEPSLRGSAEAVAALRALHRVLVAAGVTGGDMQQGQLRCDVNVSIRRPGEPLGTRVELKNLNSFRFVGRAIEDEVRRQRQRVDEGHAIVAHTRMWTGTRSERLRHKDSAADYRFLPEPDLRPLWIDVARIRDAEEDLEGVPLDLWLLDEDVRRNDAFRARHGLDDDTTRLLLERGELLSFFETAVDAGGDPAEVAKWLLGEVRRRLNDGDGLEASALSPVELVALIALLETQRVTRDGARQIFDVLWTRGGHAHDLAEELAVSRIFDVDQLRGVVRNVLARHSEPVEQYRQGKKKLVGFFMGEVMRATRGRADPALTRRLVVEELDSI